MADRLSVPIALIAANLLAAQGMSVEETNVIAICVQYHNFQETVELRAGCAEQLVTARKTPTHAVSLYNWTSVHWPILA
ncbi:MAG TPA: hypothetical protein VJ793_22455 [Anaerolineae bacterium]|nr:hypothetical protein [Anaerolineae bacterium]